MAQAAWPSEFIVLGLLCERPMHGYELAQQVEGDDALRVIWRIERSEVYFLLGKLRERGYVSESGEAKGAGPKRTVYAPTDAGRAALDEWLRTPEIRPRLLRTAFMARVHVALRQEPRPREPRPREPRPREPRPREPRPREPRPQEPRPQEPRPRELGRREPRLAAEIIAAQQAYLTEWLDQERANTPEDEYLQLVLGVRAAQVEASIAALERLRAYAEREESA